MKIKLLTTSFVALCMLCPLSCGHDDEEQIEYRIYPLTGEIVTPPDCKVYVNPSEMPDDGLVIQYTLYNSDGKQTTVFRYGEDVIFDITMRNFTDKILSLAGERDSQPRLFDTTLLDGDIKNGIFNVHRKDDTFVGYPYKPILPNTDGQVSTLLLNNVTEIYPIEYWDEYPARWTASWLGRLYDDFQYKRWFPYWAYGKKNSRLPVGEYYSEFDVHIGQGASYTVRVDFQVVE